jgi:hypothetical protein
MAIYKTVGGSWDTEELVWTSAKAPSRTHSYVYYNVILTRASVDAATATAKVYVWHGSQRSDLTGAGYCTLSWSLSSGGVQLRSDSLRKAYNNRITRTHICILTAEIDITGADEIDFQTKTNYSGSAYTTNAYVDCMLGTGGGRTNYVDTAITDITLADAGDNWSVTVDWVPSTWTEKTGAADYVVRCEMASGNREYEAESSISTAATSETTMFAVPKATLDEVLRIDVSVFDGYRETVEVRTYSSVMRPLIRLSNKRRRSLGIGCEAPDRDDVVEFASDLGVVGAGGDYSTVPVRLGKWLDTPYNVYKVVVPFAGTATSATFTAPAEIRRIVSAVGSGYGDGIGYWVPIPFASPTGLGWQASFRCAVSGDACTVELVKGSKVTFAGDSVYAEIEFVC